MIFFLGKLIFITILVILVVGLVFRLFKAENKNEDDDFDF